MKTMSLAGTGLVQSGTSCIGNNLLYTCRKRQSTFNIAVVACGQRLQETLAMIKSALLFNYSKDKLHFLVFAENHLTTSFNEKLGDWRAIRPDEFDFELLPLQFPPNSESEWRTLFKPCAAQRLFLPVTKLNEIFINC